MADTIRVVEPHRLGTEDAIERISEFESYIGKLGVKSTWRGNRAELSGTGVKGSIVVDEKNVTVVVELGMIARMAGVDAKRLEGSIRRRLQEAFAEA